MIRIIWLKKINYGIDFMTQRLLTYNYLSQFIIELIKLAEDNIYIFMLYIFQEHFPLNQIIMTFLECQGGY